MAIRYDIINSLGRDFLVLIQNGIVSVTLLEHKTMYEDYLDELKGNSRSYSKNKISTKYDISLRQMNRVIAYMEQNTSDVLMS